MRSQSAAEITASKPKGDHSGSSRKQKDAMQASQDKFSPQSKPGGASKTPDINVEQSANDESMIESDYSQEFTEQSITSKDISQSNTASKQKLKAKAKDIEESGYSETFEEDSMAKSVTMKDESASKDKMLKMDTVKEESVDDSAQSQSKDATQSMSSSKVTPGSKKQDAGESSMGSLPSEDMSVKDSVRSVEWKFDIKQQDSARDNTSPNDKQSKELSEVSSEVKKAKEEDKEESIIEEDSPIEEDSQDSDEEEDTSSDLNTRDEMQDLESCPEGVG